MIHLDSLLVSRELKGRTRTATFTEAPDILVACSAVKKLEMKGSRVFQVVLLVGVFYEKNIIQLFRAISFKMLIKLGRVKIV